MGYGLGWGDGYRYGIDVWSSETARFSSLLSFSCCSCSSCSSSSFPSTSSTSSSFSSSFPSSSSSSPPQHSLFLSPFYLSSIPRHLDTPSPPSSSLSPFALPKKKLPRTWLWIEREFKPLPPPSYPKKKNRNSSVLRTSLLRLWRGPGGGGGGGGKRECI